ncbi:MAG: propanediol utilization protein [Spirochaetes bacterium GWD1_61_31]|nr:MAG: propanediol utilization protein [Spirochaetes bacterium GWB1_60_80]OHD34026.1 MAG: propanediol utilization protein [Spirochaetes bacterium GWC1_61_12]OHD35201.1 MAG: propanediol utilization protein [Spirochaetes bacterium GWD1_61_31]OHD41406.1 MAG: propanediol utilization protein [Spirochaetes bacterium GWE1_60_18]OHD59203.1 MAG: propanediol utilization protein [Spirochaetes bacterium GWF1_60_12]HAP43096.1 propanediol utilization protein [Spirochaetaceae bacterium]
MPQTKVLVNLSNRHIHVSKEDLAALFGPGHQLTLTKDLMQPGQFACDECVTIRGPKGAIANVRILGPERKETQCEILSSDVFKLGVPGCPTRESGKLDGSFPLTIEGPHGTVKKDKGLIIAKRHIHFDPASAEAFGVADQEQVELRVDGERGAVFSNVVCRVHPSFALECHLDFDEGNAVGIASGAFGQVIRRHS